MLLDKLVTININLLTFRSGAVDRSGDRMLFGGHGVRHVLLHRCVNQRIQAVSCQALKTITSIKKIIFGFYIAFIKISGKCQRAVGIEVKLTYNR